ncbi:invasion-associated locus B family protein [Bradyrhizobium sp. CCBAU 051011]|nr:invasion-associated locus B family protein [Bradyrhizobium sp. CCBAU 051011]
MPLDSRFAGCRHSHGDPGRPDSLGPAQSLTAWIGSRLPLRRRHCVSVRMNPVTTRAASPAGNVTGRCRKPRGSTRMGRSKHQAGFGLEPARWLGGLLAVAFLFGLTQAASAQGAVRSVHGDWQIRCDTPPGAQGEQCALIQSVVAEDRSNAGLTVIVLKTADQKSKLMRVVAPLGVLLPSGLGLKLDNQDVGRAGFVRCLPNGCVAEVVMDEKLLGQLRGAKTATFIIFETPEEGIGFPLSLNGLGEGYDKLP